MNARALLIRTLALLVLQLAGSVATTSVALGQEDVGPSESLRASFISTQETRLASQAYFSRVALESHGPFGDFLFLVQKNPAAKAGAAARIAAKHAEWMKPVQAAFKEQLAKPAGLVNTRGGARHLIIVLTSDGDYLNYLNEAAQVCAAYPAANFDPHLSAVVTYERSFSKGVPKEEIRVGQRHALLHSLEQAHGTSGSRLPGPEWLAEGLAALEGWAGLKAEGKSLIPKSRLQALIQMEAAGEHHRGGLRTLKELLSHGQRLAFRGGIPYQSAGEYWRRVGLLSVQCGALVHFLRDANDGQRREAFHGFVGDAMKRSGGPATEAIRAFGDLDKLDAELWDFLHAEYAKYEPKHVRVERPKTAKGQATLSSGTGNSGVRAPLKPKKATPVQPGIPTFDPATLELGEGDADARFALAMAQASDGRLDAAVEALAALGSPRAAREFARVTALLKARDEYIAQLASTGERLRIKHEGLKLIATVEGFDDGVLTLGKNKLGVTSLPVEDIDVVELGVALGKAEGIEVSRVTLAYAYALGRDERFAKKVRKLEDDGGLVEDAAQLKDDLALGEIVQTLRTCADTPAVPSEAQAEVAIEALRRLAPAMETHDFVSSRREGLVALARVATHVQTQAMGLDELLEADVETFEAGRIRITYDFKDASQLDDFVREDRYNASYRKVWPEIGVPNSDSNCRVTADGLVAYGAVGLRMPLTFEGNQSVLYALTIGHEDDNGTTTSASFLIGMRDNRAGSMVHSFGFGNLLSIDHATGFKDKTAMVQGLGYYYGAPYEFQLDIVDDKMGFSFDGDKLSSVSVGPRKKGEVVMMLHSNINLTFRRFVVEGRLAEGGADELRARKARHLVDALLL